MISTTSPFSLPAILRNERRRMIAERIQKEIQKDTPVLEAFSRIAGELDASNGEVLEILGELTRRVDTPLKHAQ